VGEEEMVEQMHTVMLVCNIVIAAAYGTLTFQLYSCVRSAQVIFFFFNFYDFPFAVAQIVSTLSFYTTAC
jgi:hypothetical protein